MGTKIRNILRKVGFTFLVIFVLLVLVSIIQGGKCGNNFSRYILPDVELSFCAPTSYSSVSISPTQISSEVKTGEAWSATFTGEDADGIVIQIETKDFSKNGDSDVPQFPWEIFTREASEEQLENQITELYNDTSVDIAYARFDGKEFFIMSREGMFAGDSYESQSVIMPEALNDISYNVRVMSSGDVPQAILMRLVRTLKEER